MVTSNSNIDFVSLARASGIDPSTIVNTPEFADWLREYLSESKITVTFTKKDGTSRNMRCTRNGALVPTDKQPKGTGTVTTGTSIQAFDLDIGEWRSFTPASLTHIEWK
jgi:hypothetical protein